MKQEKNITMTLSKYSEALTDLGCLSKGDYHKLVSLVAYYEIYGGDKEHVQDTLDGISIDRGKGVLADGVFMNDSFEEDTCEIFSAYFPDAGGFNVDEVIKQIKDIADFTKNLKKKKFVSGHLNSEEIISDILDNEEVPPFLIKIITTADVSAKQKYEIQKQIESTPLSTTGLHIDATIAFGEDIEALIESSTEPFEYVKKDAFVVDSPVNIMHYGKDSFVCNVSAQSLKKLWMKEGHKGLLAMNLRYYIKSASIDGKIEDTVWDNPNDFWYLNNGIIVVCDNFEFVGNNLVLTNFSIVNGGQTTRMIGTIPFDHDFFICCKVIKNTFNDVTDKNRFVSAVAEASNTQKPIKAKDIIANRVEQRNLKSMMIANNVFIEIKRGEKPDKTKYVEPWQKTKNNVLAQDLLSFVYQEPGPARNNVSGVLQNEEKYRKIFVNHDYDFKFYKSLLFLEKAYETFEKKVQKDDNIDATMKSLVKNGKFYCLATIGYLLKIKYCPLYLEDVRKFRSEASLFNSYASEQAFNHEFVKKADDYKAFCADVNGLFRSIFNVFIVPVFKMEKGIKDTLSPANWTKQNTGFFQIRNTINSQMLDMHMNVLSILDNYFIELPEGQGEINDKLFQANCDANKKIKSKEGYVMKEEDGALRNELMVFRLETASAKGLKESTVYTDKQLERMVIEKPTSKEELRRIISAQTNHFVGEKIIEIIKKYA